MWEDYLESFAHARHTLLGRKLKPYCPYFHLWLRLAKSPLLTGDPVGLHDLLIASRICSSSYREDPLTPRRLDKLRFYLINLRYNLADEVAKWIAYRDDYYRPAERSGGGAYNSSKAETYPAEVYVATGLMSVLGMSQEEAWMTPMGAADWYLEMAKIHRGQETTVIPGHDREFRDGMRLLKAKKAKLNGN